MAVRRPSGSTRRTAGRADGRDRRLVDRYDLVLAVIPLSYLGSLAAHVVFGLSIQMSVIPSSLVGALLLADALYRNPPTANE